MSNKTKKTYLDKLLKDSGFRAFFEEEYATLCVAEEIAKARHAANLTQAQLAKKVGTSKTAISRYESGRYTGHSMQKLAAIAKACDAHIEFRMVCEDKK